MGISRSLVSQMVPYMIKHYVKTSFYLDSVASYSAKSSDFTTYAPNDQAFSKNYNNIQIVYMNASQFL